MSAVNLELGPAADDAERHALLKGFSPADFANHHPALAAAQEEVAELMGLDAALAWLRDQETALRIEEVVASAQSGHEYPPHDIKHTQELSRQRQSTDAARYLLSRILEKTQPNP